MKTGIFFVLLSALMCASCFHARGHHLTAVLSEAAARDIALSSAKSGGRDIERYRIKSVTVVTTKGRMRWIVMFEMKGDQIVDSDFWVDVDDQTKRALVRGPFGLNPDDL